MTDQAFHEWSRTALAGLRAELAKVLVGQQELVEALGLALICRQHVLLEGVPGLAKTLAVRSLGQVMDLQFQRVQFTPDLLPSDLLGTQVYQPQTGNFTVRKGPLFANLVLADEINRAPAKVQSALLEAMEERQITLGEQTFDLPYPFLVLATQNPIEQEGTYTLPEAQLDRFMFKIQVRYPNRDEELAVLRLKKQGPAHLDKVLTAQDLERLRQAAEAVHVDPAIEEYIVDLVRATRDPASVSASLAQAIRWGAGPRAIVFFLQGCRARAVWQGRNFVLPEDVQALAPWILRHRLLLSYEALAEGQSSDGLISQLVQGVKAP
jgi:MoxR-like ATPase